MMHFKGYIFNYFCGYNSYNIKTTKLLFFVLFHPGIVSSYKWATKVNSRWVAIIAHCRTSVTEFLFFRTHTKSFGCLDEKLVETSAEKKIWVFVEKQDN